MFQYVNYIFQQLLYSKYLITIEFMYNKLLIQQAFIKNYEYILHLPDFQSM